MDDSSISGMSFPIHIDLEGNLTILVPSLATESTEGMGGTAVEANDKEE